MEHIYENDNALLTMEQIEEILAKVPDAEKVIITEDMEEPKEETPTVH